MNPKGKKKPNVNSFPPFLSCNGPVLFLSKTGAPSAAAFRYCRKLEASQNTIKTLEGQS